MRSKQGHRSNPLGFTLAELLVALAILGVIATFTIPKVLIAQSTQRNNAIAKEAISMLSGAYQAYLMDNNGVGSTTITPYQLTPYMNYVRVDTTTAIDDWQTGTTWGCDNTVKCVQMHSGGKMLFGTASFGGTNTTNMVYVQIDPDGTYGNTTNGPGKAIYVALYYNGLVRTKGTLLSGSTTSAGAVSAASSTYDPPWFGW